MGPSRLEAQNLCDGSRRRFRSPVLMLALLGVLGGVVRGQVITEVPVLTAGSGPQGIAAGPDGALWFSEFDGSQIGRITTAGVVTEFTIPTASSGPFGIAAGPDGSLWFVESDANMIGRITTAGVVTEFPIPTDGAAPEEIAAGPDGNLWFTEYSVEMIGRITTAGVVTEFPIPTAGLPYGIAAGPDGSLWFTEVYANQIGRITAAGVVTEFPVPTAASFPSGIATGADHNLWFTEELGTKIGRITPAGVITEFPVPTANSGPVSIVAGQDGSLWFAESFGNQIGRITTAGVITEFPIPTATSNPSFIAAGSGGSLWFTEAGANNIGRITTGPTTPQPMAVDLQVVSGSVSNSNGVLEQGETVQVAPGWMNTLAAPQSFGGSASNLTGAAGPTYTIVDGDAGYGTVAGGANADCTSSPGGCYLMTVSGSRPLQHWDATFTETLNPSATPARPDTIPPPVKTWTLHVGESFPDVPTSNPFYRFIENLFHNGVTGGCAGGNYCPTTSVTRAQMAVFLMKAKARSRRDAAAGDRHGVRGRCGEQPVRPLDRAAGRIPDHGRVRQRQLLSEQPCDSRPDGRIPPEGRAWLRLHAAQLRERLPRRGLPLSVRQLDRAALRRRDHGRLRRRQLLSRQSQHARPDGRLPRQDLRAGPLRAVGDPRYPEGTAYATFASVSP